MAAPPDLVLDHLGLVHMWARRMGRSDVEREDLVQDGVIGLMKAIDAFDPDRGTAFSTFASYWIRQAIQRGTGNRPDRIGVGIDAAVAQRWVRTAVDDEVAAGRPPPSPARIAELTGFPEARVRSLMAVPRLVSADARPGPLPLEDVGTADALDRAVAVEAVRAAVAQLRGPSRTIVEARFGIGRPMVSAAEAAAEVGLSDRRARQLYARALRRLAWLLGDRAGG